MPLYGERGYGSGSGYESEHSDAEAPRRKAESEKKNEAAMYKPGDVWKKDEGEVRLNGNGEGKGNGGKRISELYDFIDFT